MSTLGKALAKADQIGVRNAKRHIFLCADPTKPKCCDPVRGRDAWAFLKSRLRELGLFDSGVVLRTRADCLRICSNGPIAVVYPEGVWYHSCDPQSLSGSSRSICLAADPLRNTACSKESWRAA